MTAGACLPLRRDGSRACLLLQYVAYEYLHSGTGRTVSVRKAVALTPAAFSNQALSDDQKRAHYDTYGHDDAGGGMRGGGGHPGFHGGRPMRPEDVFNMFEMGGGGFAFGTGLLRRLSRRPC